jgi:single-stranded-DNA-specific exonuclease
LRLRKRWEHHRPDPELVLSIAAALSVSEPVARVLVARGLKSPEAAAAFLRADVDGLENPFRMPDMARAVERLQIARSRRERVFVCGDRDTDGVTSTSLLVDLLALLGIECGWKVPAPEDGYGLSRGAIEAAAAFPSSLVIAVDCGIRDFEGVALAREKGMDVVILDHHEPGETLPAAWAVVDCKRTDATYPFPELSACGVAFKFAQAVLLAEDPDFWEREIVVFDVETSGTNAGRDEIIEIAGIKARRGIEIGRFESMIRPVGPVTAAVTAIHGITEEMLRNEPPAADAIGRFLDFVGDATLVAHNAPFDTKFLYAMARRFMNRDVPNDVQDTLTEARQWFPGISHSLGSMSTRFGFTHDEKHRAMSDVEATFQLWKRIISRRNPKLQSFLKNHLDLVALSTLADVVPLRGENRVLVKLGLEAIKKSERPGVVALRHALVRGENLTAKDVAWSIVPVLNAAGRMGQAVVAVRLLLAPTLEDARRYVAELSVMNAERKERVKTNLAAVAAELEETFDPERDAIAMVAVSDIEHGVTGIVANRVMHDLGRPVIVLIDDGSDLLTGTSRSVEGVDITAAFEKVRHLLEKFGGHSGAAGLALRKEHFAEVKEKLNAIIRSEVPPERLVPRLSIDAELRLDDVDSGLLEDLAKLEPTGHGNEAPIFCVQNAALGEVRRMGDRNQHMRLVLRDGASTLEAVAWNVDASMVPSSTDRVDVAFTVEKNEWGGKTRIQCLIEDVRIVGR